MLGVDPGVTGALALIDTAGPRFIACLDMPVMQFGTRTRVCVDARAIGDWLTETKIESDAYPDVIVIEHQQPILDERRGMPRVGLMQANMLGNMFGSILTALAPLGISFHFSVPGQWKKTAGLTRTDKEAALMKARQVFGIVPELSHGRGNGGTKVQAIARADAGLVAFFGLPERVIGKREWSRAELFMQANLP